MKLARVVGQVVATIKDPNLTGVKLLVLQPLSPRREPVGNTLVAVDGTGVGVGEDIMYVRGKESAFLFPSGAVPSDAGIVGKIDAVELET